MTDEQWRPVPGWEGYYNVSNLGRVWSVRRDKPMRSHALPHTGHLNVKLKRDGVVTSTGVHALVAAAFVGPRPEGMEVCHNNGDPSDNRLENLRYDTRRANQLDAVRHGTHSMTRKTACKLGHAYDEANTIRRSDGGRDCRICRYERTRRSRQRARSDAA